MNLRRTTCTMTIILVAAVMSPACRVIRASEFLVAEWGANAITRLVDLNGDGDALDVGERTVWADAVSGPRSISYLGSALYVMDAGTDVLRFEDLNLDGDALDVGEWTVFTDGFSFPGNIVALADGRIMVSEPVVDEVWQLLDLNGDGDALDVGERTLFADGLSGADDVIPFAGGLLVSTNVSNQVHRLFDANGDGDALDIGENSVVADGIAGGIGGARGLLDDGEGGHFVTSAIDGTISHARDLNGDGDMLDVAELLTYADSYFSTLDAPSALAGIEGTMLATDVNLGTVVMIADLNGDGDALDIGEAISFADGLSTPLDIAAVIPGAPPALPGDGNGDGWVDGLDYLLWAGAYGTHPGPDGDISDGDYNDDGWVDGLDYLLWASAYGTHAATAVPEPTAAMLVVFGLFIWAVRRRRGLIASPAFVR